MYLYKSVKCVIHVRWHYFSDPQTDSRLSVIAETVSHSVALFSEHFTPQVMIQFAVMLLLSLFLSIYNQSLFNIKMLLLIIDRWTDLDVN